MAGFLDWSRSLWKSAVEIFSTSSGGEQDGSDKDGSSSYASLDSLDKTSSSLETGRSSLDEYSDATIIATTEAAFDASAIISDTGSYKTSISLNDNDQKSVFPDPQLHSKTFSDSPDLSLTQQQQQQPSKAKSRKDNAGENIEERSLSQNSISEAKTEKSGKSSESPDLKPEDVTPEAIARATAIATTANATTATATTAIVTAATATTATSTTATVSPTTTATTILSTEEVKPEQPPESSVSSLKQRLLNLFRGRLKSDQEDCVKGNGEAGDDSKGNEDDDEDVDDDQDSGVGSPTPLPLLQFGEKSRESLLSFPEEKNFFRFENSKDSKKGKFSKKTNSDLENEVDLDHVKFESVFVSASADNHILADPNLDSSYRKNNDGNCSSSTQRKNLAIGNNSSSIDEAVLEAFSPDSPVEGFEFSPAPIEGFDFSKSSTKKTVAVLDEHIKDFALPKSRSSKKKTVLDKHIEDIDVFTLRSSSKKNVLDDPIEDFALPKSRLSTNKTLLDEPIEDFGLSKSGSSSKKIVLDKPIEDFALAGPIEGLIDLERELAELDDDRFDDLDVKVEEELKSNWKTTKTEKESEKRQKEMESPTKMSKENGADSKPSRTMLSKDITNCSKDKPKTDDESIVNQINEGLISEDKSCEEEISKREHNISKSDVVVTSKDDPHESLNASPRISSTTDSRKKSQLEDELRISMEAREVAFLAEKVSALTTNSTLETKKSQLEDELRISMEAREVAFAAEKASASKRMKETERKLKRKEEEKREAVLSLESMKKSLKQKEIMIQNLVEEGENTEQSATPIVLRQIESDRDATLRDFEAMEKSFSELHLRYEKSKEIADGFKKNESVLQQCIEDFQSAMDKERGKYALLKTHAEKKLALALQEIDKERKSSKTEKDRLNAALKVAELKFSQLSSVLEEKRSEGSELHAICQELIGKVGGGGDEVGLQLQPHLQQHLPIDVDDQLDFESSPSKASLLLSSSSSSSSTSSSMKHSKQMSKHKPLKGRKY